MFNSDDKIEIDLQEELINPHFENYTEAIVNKLIAISSDKKDDFISIQATELIYNYVKWLETRETSLSYILKDNINFYFNYWTTLFFNRLHMRRPELCNTIASYFINDNHITSDMVINKIIK